MLKSLFHVCNERYSATSRFSIHFSSDNDTLTDIPSMKCYYHSLHFGIISHFINQISSTNPTKIIFDQISAVAISLADIIKQDLASFFHLCWVISPWNAVDT